MRHGLIITSLRDIQAVCKCGGWTLTGTTSDRDKDHEIRDRILRAYETHHRHRRPGIKLSADERRALREFAAVHGNTWKAELRHQWETGQAAGILVALRNASYFGPRGLQRVRKSDIDAAIII